jgi:hypothetical protein
MALSYTWERTRLACCSSAGATRRLGAHAPRVLQLRRSVAPRLWRYPHAKRVRSQARPQPQLNVIALTLPYCIERLK